MQWLYYELIKQKGIEHDLAFFIIGILISISLILIPVLVASIVPLFIKKPKRTFSIYLYAFITGMLIILGTFGYLREAMEITSTGLFFRVRGYYLQSEIYSWNLLFVFGGAMVGIVIAFLMKFVIAYYISKKIDKNSIFVHSHGHSDSESHNHDNHTTHNHNKEHSDIIFNKNDVIEMNVKIKNKNKWTALFLLLGHRVPEGLLIGLGIATMINNANSQSLSIAFFISFVLHTMPEEIIFFYRQREMGISPLKASLNSTGAIALIIPFIFIGLYGFEIINKLKWMQAFTQAIVGSIMLFTALVEFIPEFYHTNMKRKEWIITISILFAGILFAIFVLSFHMHR